MKSDLRAYHAQRHETAIRAESVRSLLSDEGSYFFEGVSGMEPVRKLWRQSIEAYRERTGRLPADNLLASAHAALERLIDTSARKDIRVTGPLFESVVADMSTSEGVLHQANWAAIFMPTLLSSSTTDLCTFVNAKAETTDLLQLVAVALSGSDGVSPGEILDGSTYGQLGTMNRLLRLDPLVAGNLPDGTKTTFTFSTADLPSASRPIRPGTVRLCIDGDIVHVDLDQMQYTPSADLVCPPGNPFPSGVANSYSHIKVHIDYLQGVVTLDFTTKPPAVKTEITVEVDLDEEQEPRVIAQMSERCFRAKVHASRYMMQAESTVQAFHDFRRESGLDLSDSLTNAAANWLASEVDMRRLRTALFYCKTPVITIEALRKTDSLEVWAEGLKRRIIEESDKMQAKNRHVGITGAYAGEKIAQLFRSFPASIFQADPDAALLSGIRRAGRLFNLVDVWIVPEKACNSLTIADPGFKPFKTNDVLFFGSDSMGHSPLIAGDGIPPTIVNSGTPASPAPDLRFRGTVFGTEITALNPFGGADYMIQARFDNV